MSAKETQQIDTKITTHYWGYRELDASEFKYVGGGDDGGDSGDSGGGCDSGGGGGSCDTGDGGGDASSGPGNVNPTGDNGVSCTDAGVNAYADQQQCNDTNALALAGLVQGMLSAWGSVSAGANAYSNWCSDGR
jgi:hypothetical protein